MIFGSVCSGIEAASVAWAPLGWRAAFVSEIEPFPCALLNHHYPDAPNHGDMTRFKEWPDASLDVLCGGTPCQSFSFAGLRAGLDDPRGDLMLTFGAVAERYRPRWLVWENVPGVLSSNGGRDFGAFLGLLGVLGYGFAYRVLDAQYVRVDGFGRAVPQRRNRVFVVGCLGDWRSAAAVLFERESLRGDPAPRRQAGQAIAACLTRGAESSGKGGYAGRSQEDDTNIVIARALASSDGGIDREDRHTLVAHTLTGEGFDASEDGSGRGVPLVPVAFGGNNTSGPIEVSTALSASAANRSNPKAGDPCHTLAKGAHAPAIASATRVRRLMPVECERLMGFPPIAERVIFTICIEPQNHCATVALRCLRWPSSASPADGEGLPLFASTAEVDSSIRHPGQGVLAALYARPLFDGSAAQIHSHARSGSSASGASAQDLSRRQALDEATAHSLALTLRELAHLIRSGRAASPLNMLLSTAASSGSVHALMSGAASVPSASDVSSVRNSGTFTTSELGRLAPISASHEATLCCSVMAAIGGFIQEETLPGCFSLEATVLTPYTAIPYRGKPATDGHRYRALGNSWAVNCARWIGRRIAIADRFVNSAT